MADVKHTPGPWQVNYTRISQVTASNGALIATCEKLDGLTTLQANARLIADAPALLDIARRLAQLQAGLRNGNSSAEELACELAGKAAAIAAKHTGAARATEGSV